MHTPQTPLTELEAEQLREAAGFLHDHFTHVKEELLPNGLIKLAWGNGRFEWQMIGDNTDRERRNRFLAARKLTRKQLGE